MATKSRDFHNLITFFGIFLVYVSNIRAQSVWSLSISPVQTTLQRNDFYVAMRAVALAQSGEDTLTRERVRETATNAVAIATFKGGEKPPIKISKGKKEKQEKSKWFSKTTTATTGSNKGKESRWFSKTTPTTGSSKGAVPTIPPTSGLPKGEDGAGSSRAGKGITAARSTKSEQKRVQASEKETNDESRRLSAQDSIENTFIVARRHTSKHTSFVRNLT